jgi:dTDP-4-amino-4,6-dideoxygalactose transaminase
MMSDKIYLSSPHMGGTERNFVNEAFDTNWISPIGKNVDGFEGDLKSYLGGEKHVAALSSGTAALHMALLLIGVERDDEVICQSMTFAASANPIVYVGAKPIFVDSETDTWNMCPEALEIAIKDRIAKGKKPKAIIGVHLYGMPFKVTEICSIAIKYNIPLIEDSAEALGSSFKGQKCGTFGDMSILSFNGNKIITTSGGGALVAASESLKNKAVFLASQARDHAPHYQHSEIGYNYRLSNICAGIGRGQMQVLDKHVSLRRKMNQFYQDLFINTEGVTVFKEPTGDYYSNHWLTCVLIDEKTTGYTPSQVRGALAQHNIESRPLWKPMHLQPIFKEAPFYGNGVSERLFKLGLCLPSGSNLSEADRERITIALKPFL